MKRLAYITVLAVALALAAGTHTAVGSTRPDDRAVHGQGAIVLEQRNDVVRPDDRAMHGQGAVEFEQVTRAGQVPTIAPGGSAGGRSDEFDWLDAGIGAAGALGLGLIVAGSVAVRRRTHAPAYT
jgi:hypothetical protein